MFCCSRKTSFILLGVAGVIALLITSGKINAYAVLPFLPFLICPFMCFAMMMFGRKCDDGSCEKNPGPKNRATPQHSTH